MESSIKKDIILNGTDSIAVFKEDGLVYRAKELESYTPIVFYDLKANKQHQFDLKDILGKEYLVVAAGSDVESDDDFISVSDIDANNAGYASCYFSIVRLEKRVFCRSLLPTKEFIDQNFITLTPGDTVLISPLANLNSLTLYCVPIYLEKTITVSGVIINEPVDQGDAGTGDGSDNK